MNAERTILIAGLIVLACAAARAQTNTLTWHGQTGDSIPVDIGAPTSVNVDAYPNTNYALLGSRGRSSWYSDIGLIEVDLLDPDFQVAIDGFDPAHNLFSWGFVNANGDFDFAFVPYPAGNSVSDRIYLQVLANDPTAGPWGLSVSNLVGASSQALSPQVYTISPRSGTPGTTITITGDYFDGTPSAGQTLPSSRSARRRSR